VAICAGLRSRLLGVALHTLNNFYSMAIHGVSLFGIFFILIVHFVMTEATGYKGVAAATGCQEKCFAFIVLATSVRF
jgi:hypothetical protein